jgi:cytochrome c oxidase subunit 3
MTTSAAAPMLTAGAAPTRGKVGMWLFLATDAMGFGGLLAAYGVLRVRADAWPDPHARLAVPQAALMTLALVTSSLTVTLAVRAARAGRGGARAGWLAATIALGVAFLAGQALEYRHLLHGSPPMHVWTDTFASTFYALTGYHGAHVLAGVLLLGTLLATRASDAGTLAVAALFWHFVDLAWIPIFSLFYLLPVT